MNRPIQPDEAQPIPTNIVTVPTSVVEGNSLSVTVTLNCTTTADTVYPLDTDHRSLINPPSGQTSWPAHYTVPNGHSGTSFTLGTQGSTSATAKLVTCPSGEDVTNPSNITASCNVTLTAQTPP